MPEVYVVVVEHNLVSAIERTEPPPEPIPATPLEVSTQLAANHRTNGCLDGRYYFTNTQAARTFAALCLTFVKALAEKRLAAVDSLAVGTAHYRADEDRDRDRTVPGAT
jgi:hypothetical protein